MICGTAFKNKGVQTMLDAVVDYLPSPLDVPPIEGADVDDPEKMLIRKASDNEPFSALVFKIMTDPYVGQLAFFRVYSGTLKSGESVYNVAKGRKERIGRLLRMHANKREEIQEILAGDICAAVGSEDGLDRRHDLRRRASDRSRIDRLPDAGDSARGRAEDQGRPGKAGHGDSEAGAGRSHVPREYRSRNRADDSFRHGRAAPGNHRRPHDARVRRRRQCRQAAGGVSRDHPQDRGSRRPARQAVGRPRPVRRREDPRGAAAPGGGFEFVNEIYGGTIPKEYIKPIEAGIKEALEGGILAGYPDVGREGDAVRRQLSRRRFVGNGVQDLPARWRSRKPPGRPSRCCSSRSWRSKWWCRKSTWAT